MGHVEEVFAFQLAIFEAAASLNARCLNPDVERTGLYMAGRKTKPGIPLLERAGQIDGRFDVKLDQALLRRDRVSRNLRVTGSRQHSKQQGTNDAEGHSA
jgi:hypothetical protein